jgi:hypothetical protein
MTTVGFSGHQNLPAASIDYISRQVRSYLVSVPPPLVGMTSLAAGADQLFAQIVLDIGGRLRAVIPSRDYPSTFSTGQELRRYTELLEVAEVSRLDYATASEHAYLAAGEAVADAADCLLAVWDGQASRGLGGTADVVAYARRAGKPVTVIWPAGVER